MLELLDGAALAAKIRKEIKEKLDKQEKKPKLAVILVGDDPASQVYVSMKEKACAEAGIISEKFSYGSDVTQQELFYVIDKLNEDPECSGILCQLPLPNQIDDAAIIERISPKKDVDCFHPENAGRLFTGNPLFSPCTPAGVIELMKEYDIEMTSKHAVIVGRSNIVGKPLASLLLAENATVTVCHSKTKDLDEVCRSADILCAAVGKAEMIKGSWVKEGAVVIDVGTNRVGERLSEKTGKKLAVLKGDVEFEEASKRASYITPVPKGVGPMTIAMLLRNTVTAFNIQNNS